MGSEMCIRDSWTVVIGREAVRCGSLGSALGVGRVALHRTGGRSAAAFRPSRHRGPILVEPCAAAKDPFDVMCRKAARVQAVTCLAQLALPHELGRTQGDMWMPFWICLQEKAHAWRDLSEKRALSARRLFLWMVGV